MGAETLKLILGMNDYTALVDEEDAELRKSIPFLACGDLCGWDSDASYALPSSDEGYLCLDVVQPPISPAYKEALARMKNLGK